MAKGEMAKLGISNLNFAFRYFAFRYLLCKIIHFSTTLYIVHLSYLC
jgi:hypothetical protein